MKSSRGELPWTVEEVEREITGWVGKEIVGMEVMETVEEGGKETVAVSIEGPVAV
jgi:hypothetical protein